MRCLASSGRNSSCASPPCGSGDRGWSSRALQAVQLARSGRHPGSEPYIVVRRLDYGQPRGQLCDARDHAGEKAAGIEPAFSAATITDLAQNETRGELVAACRHRASGKSAANPASHGTRGDRPTSRSAHGPDVGAPVVHLGPTPQLPIPRRHQEMLDDAPETRSCSRA